MDQDRPQGRDVIGGYLEHVGTIEEPTEFDPSQSSDSIVDDESAASDAPLESGEVSSAGEADANTQGMKMNLVLRRLAHGDRAPIGDLANELRMPMLETATLLGKLSASGLIVIDGEPGREKVTLTEAGRTVAEIAAS